MRGSRTHGEDTSLTHNGHAATADPTAIGADRDWDLSAKLSSYSVDSKSQRRHTHSRVTRERKHRRYAIQHVAQHCH